MAIKDMKITDVERNNVYVKSNTGSRLTGTVEENKNAFDKYPELIRTRLNEIVDALSGMGVDNAVVSTDFGFLRLNADKVLEVSSDGETWTETASSGHIIFDEEGVEYPQRARLKFLSTDIADDGTYTIIQGVKGDKGDTGATGLKGDKGERGDKGETGDTGSVLVPTVNDAGVISWTLQTEPIIPSPQSIRGPQGVQGVQGEQGVAGARGPQGIQGVQGVQGIQGKQGEKGATGAKGDTGAQGPIGPQGIQGEKGADGKSFVIQDIYATLGELKAAYPTGNEYAYQVTAENKEIFIWSEKTSDWESLGALQGPQGPQGIQGIQGEKGDTGDTGPQGDQGIQGIQGEQGPEGPEGPQGVKGDTGASGTDGKSAYKQAQEAGYTGTESEFATSLSNLPSDTNTEIQTLTTSISKRALTTLYSGTLGTSWAASGEIFTQSVSVSGILASDTPVLDLICSTSNFEAEQEAWGKVFKAVCSANTITFYASEATEVSVSFNAKVVR